MDKTERFYKIDQLIRLHTVVDVHTLMEELGVSLATFKRDLEYMRDRLHAPIVYDRDNAGYRYDDPNPNSPTFELPGLWFNASEVHALLTMQQLLQDLEPGLLARHIDPLLSRLKLILESEDTSIEEVGKRIRILRSGARTYNPAHFELVASALLKRKQITVQHYNRVRDETVQRTISPQRLVHYRRNWYVDSWCHLRNDIRSFALDAIRNAVILEQGAKEISEDRLNKTLASGYGIFGGEKVQWAKLRFTATAARWVSNERWHKDQRTSEDKDGNYLLELPFSNSRELLMDILKYGPDCEVLAPSSLRKEVRGLVDEMSAKYG
ncbi:MAG: YafY family transcriptional regulator [Rhodocyclaceae bacterium]|nr:YafY family transcriptional regulator [Rhodocyclaceae bacterium]MCA3081279.1 YafY family transcriptional regulator [Rhodocyclaceae bacterium]